MRNRIKRWMPYLRAGLFAIGAVGLAHMGGPAMAHFFAAGPPIE